MNGMLADLLYEVNDVRHIISMGISFPEELSRVFCRIFERYQPPIPKVPIDDKVCDGRTLDLIFVFCFNPHPEKDCSTTTVVLQ